MIRTSLNQEDSRRNGSVFRYKMKGHKSGLTSKLETINLIGKCHAFFGRHDSSCLTKLALGKARIANLSSNTIV